MHLKFRYIWVFQYSTYHFLSQYLCFSHRIIYSVSVMYCVIDHLILSCNWIDELDIAIRIQQTHVVLSSFWNAIVTGLRIYQVRPRANILCGIISMLQFLKMVCPNEAVRNTRHNPYRNLLCNFRNVHIFWRITGSIWPIF